MTAGSIGSRFLTAVSLIAVMGAVGGLFTMALKGARPPVHVAQSAVPPAAEAATLSGEDVASATRLDQAFQRMGYRLDSIGDGAADVPPLFLTQVPGDMDELPDIDTKKAVFLRVMLPLVLAVDEQIAGDRAHLLDLAARRAADLPLSPGDQRWLEALARDYEVENGNLKTLITRVDVVPPSLALAQSAEESGWGTSKLVRRSQNLFGHTVEQAGDEPGMRNFGTLYEAVGAYVHNLNTHKAYGQLRRTRATARAQGRAPDGQALVTALHGYSERGDAYVSTIRALMRHNDLVRFDHAHLGRALPARMASAS